MIRRILLPLLGLGCSLTLLLACYRGVLFQDGQFAGFDAAFFYYPLYLRIQQEWAAGRWPLWDPGQNGGVPLLGLPMAAVFYPGKLVYALLPYQWAARLYVVMHTFIALLGVWALARALGVSRPAGLMGGLSYAFGAPVLLLTGNLILLVGAAWLPWGLRAIDGLFRQPRGRRRWAAGLAVVLALQVLGGDPEAAYLTVVCGAGYAIVLAWHATERRQPLRTWPTALGMIIVWVAGTLVCATVGPAAPSRWLPGARMVVPAAWIVLGIALAWRWRGHRDAAPLTARLVGLAGACALAAALAAVQLLPGLEFAAGTERLAEDVVLNVYRFSLEPHRVIELFWPNVFGTMGPENHSWLRAVLPTRDRAPWLVSLYLGGFPLILALSAAGIRGVPPWRAWLTVVATVGLAASLGKFASPLWWARWGPWAAALGPHDPLMSLQRDDAFFYDGAWSPYAILATILPGFGVFRYPCKLFTPAAVALAVLAAAGWDGLVAGQAQRLRRLGWAGLGVSVLGSTLALAGRAPIVAVLSRYVPADPAFGPADVSAAWMATQRALVHGMLVFAAALALARATPRHPRRAAALALLFLTGDLALANAGLVWTVPQADLETLPEAALRIATAEAATKSSGPFRIYRMPDWLPPHFAVSSSPRRLHEQFAWNRRTLQPLYGLPLGLEYCTTQGILELDDHRFFFSSELLPMPAAIATIVGLPAGRPVRYYPRRGFDLWGARYFLLPADPLNWDSEARGFASFLHDTELIYPAPGVISGENVPGGSDSWRLRDDWQLRRNRAAFPRAWLVHTARVRPPATSLAERQALMSALLFMNDPLWSDPKKEVFDLRTGALVETDDRDALRGYLARRAPEPSESVVVVRDEPQRVELRAMLKWPGLVILADTYYPGWRLTIDGTPAPILRANRMMRGAAVAAGEHTLVYTFRPQSVQIGAIVSAAGLMLLLAALWPRTENPAYCLQPVRHGMLQR
jgi:hypothetical protein